MANILITGGAGYIGSHTSIALLNAGYQVIVLDNLSNSHPQVFDRVQQITGQSLTFVQGDILDEQCLNQIFQDYSIDAVIHFAGLKAVGESQKKPLIYFENNIAGTLQLIKAMQQADVYTLVFSSSATVYGDGHIPPFNEAMATQMPHNNYGYTKFICEQILQKMTLTEERWSIALLRYFNPIGAHESGLIGEDPRGIPNNLLPYITQVASGLREKLLVYGDDYPTIDGTGVRDYIHVMDLANAHLHALNNRLHHQGCRAWNIGTGKGYSVLQIIKAFEQVTGISIKYEIVSRRAGDIASAFSDPKRAMIELDWQAQRSLEDMLRDSWHWQKQNPYGYLG